MAGDRPLRTLSLPVKLFVYFWLIQALLGALNHSIFPSFAGRFDFRNLPHIRYGYVMFNQSPPVVSVISVKPANQHQWFHIADLVNTPAPFYKRTRTLIDILFTQFDYMLALCVREERAHGAAFLVQRHAPGYPERRRDDQYICHEQRLYPDK